MNKNLNLRPVRPRKLLGTAGLLVAALVLSGVWGCSKAHTMNGFDVSQAEVPASEIQRGGPPRDGIPALTDPEFLSPGQAHWLGDDERVLGVHRNGVAKAYPLGIMNYHEIVNDLFAGEPIAVTYCPLCFSGLAFEAEEPDGTRLMLGVSGLLYNSDVLLYDRRSESLWSQIGATAISGPRRGENLETVPTANTTWRAWREEHPDSLVLSRDTDYSRNYDRDPYVEYAEDEALMFPVRFRTHGQHPKTPILGVEIDGQARAYPLPAFPATGRHEVEDELAGEPITILIDSDAQTGRVLDEQGEEITSLVSYWFAWFAFHPDTDLYAPGQ